jgi:hypothetical protein
MIPPNNEAVGVGFTGFAGLFFERKTPNSE